MYKISNLNFPDETKKLVSVPQKEEEEKKTDSAQSTKSKHEKSVTNDIKRL